jgi:hypothetical protein
MVDPNKIAIPKANLAVAPDQRIAVIRSQFVKSHHAKTLVRKALKTLFTF